MQTLYQSFMNAYYEYETAFRSVFSNCLSYYKRFSDCEVNPIVKAAGQGDIHSYIYTYKR